MLRTSGVSSGATSGSSGSNPAYWRPAQPAAATTAAARADQRKFSTLSRAQQQQQQRGKSSQVLRTRSFQVGNSGNSNSGKLSCFSPSENSAFHCISANNNRGEAAQLSQSQVRQRIVISILTLVLRRIRR